MTSSWFSLRSRRWRLLLAGAVAALVSGAALADPIRHPTAIFAGLDKTTGRIINFEVAIDETVQFGSLQVTPRVCNTRPQTEAPQTTSFVEVDEQDGAKNEAKRIFSGWMFAASPGLHGVEHPVYDVWLTDCKGGKELATPAAAPDNGAAAAGAAPPPEKKRTRSRKVEPVAPTPIESAPLGPRDSAPLDPGARAPDGGAVPIPAAPIPEKPKKKKKPQTAPAPQPAPSSGLPFPF